MNGAIPNKVYLLLVATVVVSVTNTIVILVFGDIAIQYVHKYSHIIYAQRHERTLTKIVCLYPKHMNIFAR